MLALVAGYFGLKKIAGRDVFLNKESAAEEYVRTRLYNPMAFTGSNADMQALLSSETDSCAAFVKSKGVLVSGARETCANKIQLAYADVIASRQGEEYSNDQAATAQFFQNNATFIIIVAVVLIIIFIALYK